MLPTCMIFCTANCIQISSDCNFTSDLCATHEQIHLCKRSTLGFYFDSCIKGKNPLWRESFSKIKNSTISKLYCER